MWWWEGGYSPLDSSSKRSLPRRYPDTSHPSWPTFSLVSMQPNLDGVITLWSTTILSQLLSARLLDFGSVSMISVPAIAASDFFAASSVFEHDLIFSFRPGFFPKRNRTRHPSPSPNDTEGLVPKSNRRNISAKDGKWGLRRYQIWDCRPKATFAETGRDEELKQGIADLPVQLLHWQLLIHESVNFDSLS